MELFTADVTRAGVLDVAKAAWLGAGAPRIESVREGPVELVCARCATTSAVTAPIAAVVSKTFTAFDTWRVPGGAALCAGCAWLYRTARLRAAPLLVTRDPVSVTHLDADGAAHVLSSPLPAGSALIVPLHPGRKHLVPTACWDRVTVDDASLAWTIGDVERLGAVRRLRSVGFSTRMMRQPAPVWAVLRGLPHRTWPDIDQDWRLLATWRTRPLWLDLALSVTRVGGRAEAA